MIAGVTVASYIVGIVMALLTLIVVVEFLRRRRMRERHAVWWLVAGTVALVVSLFPQLLVAAAKLIGVAVPANLIFFLSAFVLFLVSIQHSSELTRAEEQARTLAEEVAILKLRMQRVEDTQDGSSKPAGPSE
jgi:hypothetical protein